MRTALDTVRLGQLAAIIRSRSISKASEILGISQPALSKNIRSLERELGVRLLERGRFGATPTPFGLALARHADAIDAELRTAREEIDSLRSARSGHVRIGCGPSEATRLLPLALERLHQQAPGVGVTVHYGLNEALMPMVRHGEVDLALSSVPARSIDADLTHVLLHEDAAAIVARTGHPLLARGKAVLPQHLLSQRWILPRSEELERRALDDLFIEAELSPPKADIETTSAILMKTMVILSDYLTFLPRELIYWEERCNQLTPLRILTPTWRRRVGVTLRARGVSSPASQTVIEMLKAVARSFGSKTTTSGK